MGKVAVFIDSGYVSKILKSDFGEPSIDYEKVVKETVSKIDKEVNLLKTYFYDCPPYQSDNPTPEERKRFANKEKFFTALESIPRFTVRKGKLAKRGTDCNGDPIFIQKRVDIMFGVDLVKLSLKGKISHAIIITGDSDFLPAIEVARNEGVTACLLHGSSCHSELRQKVDERWEIDQDFVNKIIRE